ncbi:MAG: acylphosphatase, partial [Deltaproteobacteria bacterium]|nr:acylphosphatase [Deltaproteobacteria bacterium]
YYAREKALSLGVSGWIRNLRDGSVEGMAEGDRESVKSFIEWCNKGPPSASVDEIITEDTVFSGIDGFEIRH